jgi:hypothetical protein
MTAEPAGIKDGNKDPIVKALRTVQDEFDRELEHAAACIREECARCIKITRRYMERRAENPTRVIESSLTAPSGSEED